MPTCSTCTTGHRGSLKESLMIAFAALAGGVALAGTGTDKKAAATTETNHIT